MENCRWEALPYPILVYTFSYLPMKDRRNAGQCCQSWYNAFISPQLWRYLVCKFHSHTGSEAASTACVCVNDNAFPVVLHTAKWLKHLRIEWVPDLWPNEQGGLDAKFPLEFTMILADFFNKILKSDKIPQLYGIYLTSSWTLPLFDKTVDRTTTSLVEFLRSQKTLRHFYIDWQLNAVNGIQIVKAVSLHCCTSLTELNIQKCFSPLSQRNPNWFLVDLAQYKKLSALHMDYSDFTEQVLKTVTKACVKTLKSISIICPSHLINKNPFLLRRICSEVWKDVKQQLPYLTVSFELENANWNVHNLETVIPREVPLRYLAISFYEPKINCITYLKSFSEYLEKVVMDLEVDPSILRLEQRPEEINTSSLVELLTQCTKLHTMEVIGKLPLDILNQVFTLKLNRQIGLKNLKIDFLNLSSGEETILQEQIERYSTLPETFNFTFNSVQGKVEENFDDETPLNLEQVNSKDSQKPEVRESEVCVSRAPRCWLL